MLAYVLAIAVALGSLCFYLAAFFVPEMHRRQDFFWSGLGLFYAVVLWFCAGRITGAVLLGQIASVALLGGLGWHTLSLRRSLTPELVRTPITWADLQRWFSRLQSYLQLGAVGAGLKTFIADLGKAIADLRRNLAGPYAEDTIGTEVPPLKRSPAYEFETTAGTGESTSSEFATVVAPHQASSATIPPGTENVGQSPSSEVRDVALPADTASISLASNRPTVTPAPSASSVTQPTAPPTVQPGASPQPVVTPTSRTRTLRRAPNPAAGLGAWLGDVVKSVRKPKPQRTVIEVPPRPPSIPRPDKAATNADPQKWTTAPTPLKVEVDNWVDVGDLGEDVPSWQEEGEIETSPMPGESPAIAQEMTTVAPEMIEPPPGTLKSSPVADDTNWPDEDTNWPD